MLAFAVLSVAVAVSIVAGAMPAKQRIELPTGVTLAYFETGNPEGDRRPLPESGVQDDLGHNVRWGAASEVAADLAAYLGENGAPTPDLYYSDPGDPRRVLTAPGEVVLIRGGEARGDTMR